MSGCLRKNVQNKRLVISWAEQDKLSDESKVTFEIELINEVVRLSVTHNELSDYMAGRISFGWPMVLSGLKTLLETGKAIDLMSSKSCGSQDAA